VLAQRKVFVRCLIELDRSRTACLIAQCSADLSLVPQNLRYNPVQQDCSVVILGRMNPAIFSPAWLRLNDVITEKQLEAAKVNLIHNDVTDFEIDTFKMQITPQRFSIATGELPYLRLVDVARKIFGDILTHTPVTFFGVNLQLHFDLESFDRRTALGRSLAPTEPWTKWGKRLNSDDPQRVGGMRTLTMEESRPSGRSPGSYRRVQIEPSLKPGLERSGVFMAINDHFACAESPSTGLIVKTLQENFDQSIEMSRTIVSDMMTFASKLIV